MADWNCNKCRYGLSEDYTVCMECRRGSKYEEKSISWGDKIRSMNDEELAEFLECVETAGYHDESITPMENGHSMDMLKWLKSEAKE